MFSSFSRSQPSERSERKTRRFKMSQRYLLLSLFLRPVIFYLNGFNSALTSGCQRTEKAPPLSFSAHQSFIGSRIHQPILVITDYSRDHTLSHTHGLLTARQARNQKHIFTLEGLERPDPPPLVSQRCYLTHFGFRRNSNEPRRLAAT